MIFFVAYLGFLFYLTKKNQAAEKLLSSSDIEKEEDSNYLKLTSLMHIKDNSYEIKLSDLKSILHNTINSNKNWTGYNLNKSVIDYIYEKADFIIKEKDQKYSVGLEAKIVLSIAS